VAFGDFNQDGKRDLAIYSRDEHAVLVHFGDGSGAFSSGTPFRLPGGHRSHGELLSADLNGDGHMDLLLALNLLDRVMVLLGTGTGSLVFSPSAYSVPAPVGLLSADLNEDGAGDIAVASNTDGKLYVLWSARSPLLSSPVGYDAWPGATTFWAGVTRLAATDFDGDGHFDVAVVPGTSGAFAILPGDGRGGFRSPLRISFGSTAGWRIRALDLDQDHRQDLIITGFDPPGVLVLLNRTTPRS
jgi:hypothetical protein